VRAVVVGASSGLGRCLGVGLARRGAQVALLARRRDRLTAAADEAGPGALAIECDVTDAASVSSAIGKAAADLGGIDALVYTPAIGPLLALVDTEVETWRKVFDTNVIGAATVTAAAIPHLTSTNGTAVYLSSVSASVTPPWPGLGAYAASKAALDKLVEAWRVEHPTVGFTRCIVGDCIGGEGDSMTGFPVASGWDMKLAAELYTVWEARGLLAGCFIDVEDLVDTVDALLRSGGSIATPSITLTPRSRIAREELKEDS
jgi:NAD(P)-dependent dehydrogenase (short-subunit alcohol dehydrogenase family)